jgi:DNA topoisomerase-1
MRVIVCQKLLFFFVLLFTMLTNAFQVSRGSRRWSRTFAASKGALKDKEKVLVIVESPAKARTIQKFLKDMKDEQREYVVDSCQGHIRDLAKELPAGVKQKSVCPGLRVRLSDLGVDVFDNFKPFYVTLTGKEDIVKRLKDASKSADKILLATDEDREGEAISWHLVDVLKPKAPYQVSVYLTLRARQFLTRCFHLQRAVFHEITKKAIEKSFAEPRELDMNLVHAQETRRIVDKLAGFTLSPLLWKFIAVGLSAGRVQTYGLSMIANVSNAFQ